MLQAIMVVRGCCRACHRNVNSLSGTESQKHSGTLPRTRQNRYPLTILDFATRYPEAISLRKVDAPTVATALMEAFTRFGLPAEILSDNGSVFVGKLMEELFRQLGVHHIHTTPYRPQTNGMIERWHGVLKAQLRKADEPVE